MRSPLGEVASRLVLQLNAELSQLIRVLSASSSGLRGLNQRLGSLEVSVVVDVLGGELGPQSQEIASLAGAVDVALGVFKGEQGSDAHGSGGEAQARNTCSEALGSVGESSVESSSVAFEWLDKRWFIRCVSITSHGFEVPFRLGDDFLVDLGVLANFGFFRKNAFLWEER